MLARIKENNKYLTEVLQQVAKHFESTGQTNSPLFKQIELTLIKCEESTIELDIPMTIVDYYAEKGVIDEIHKKQRQKLARKYSLSHNTVKIGDKIESRQGDRMIVETISFTCPQYELPQCVYRGPHVTKRGELSKRKDNKIVIFKEQLQ